MKKTALYPGTFDPITFGHIDIIKRSSALFDKVIISIAIKPEKKTLFTIEERTEMVIDAVKGLQNVSAARFDGLLVDFAKKKKAEVIVRGLRAVSDFEYEFQMALTNRKMEENITTVFLMPHERYTYLNSTLVRELAKHGAKLSSFVPKHVEKKLREKFKID